MPFIDPVRLLLRAYEAADLAASITYDAHRATKEPRCQCRQAAREAFRREFQKHLA